MRRAMKPGEEQAVPQFEEGQWAPALFRVGGVEVQVAETSHNHMQMQMIDMRNKEIYDTEEGGRSYYGNGNGKGNMAWCNSRKEKLKEATDQGKTWVWNMNACRNSLREQVLHLSDA